MSQAFDAAFLIVDILLVLVYRKALSVKERTVFILYSVIPLAALAFSPIWEVTPVYMASTVVLLLYNTLVHVEHEQRVAEQETQLIRQELELTNNRTAIILSQINPHFLYNSLTAIAQLCEKNSKKAKEVTIYFSEYLRQNMNALEQKTPVPFEKELEHTRIYLSIEQVRFGDKLHVVYDIGSTAFQIPSLCLQPIVENAVKHGLGMKENGGTVIIRTRELPDSFEITVSDDGVGFDANRTQNDNRTHIGIQNVRERLEKTVGAQMEIKSEIGRGSDVIIQIPKQGAQI
ncbi:MAG: histidine kinase [Oscillospiraceae bacterium]|nr:histidine kinase [Oscillospiraceae bacterium]